MRVLILNGSPRPKGNTKQMINAFCKGLESAGHEWDVYDICKMNIHGCLACEYCHTKGNGQCIQKDDMQTIYHQLQEALMLVIASPIYYHGLSGQLKCAIDRFYATNKVGYHIKSAALLLNSHSENVFDGAIATYKALLRYLKWEDKGIVAISGMTAPESMANDPRLQQVVALAKSL